MQESIQQNPARFHDTRQNKLGIEWNCLNLIKAIFEKPTVNVIFDDGRLNAFLLRSATRQRC